MPSQIKDAVLVRIQRVENGVLVLHVFDKKVPSTFQEVKKAYRILTNLIHPNPNSGHYKLQFQVISRAFEIDTRFLDKLIRHNGFDSHQRKYIEVQLDVLFFYNDTDEETQKTLEEQEEGEHFKVSAILVRKCFKNVTKRC